MTRIRLGKRHVCDFCGKGEEAVAVMIVSPEGSVDICDECVAVCAEAIAETMAKKVRGGRADESNP